MAISRPFLLALIGVALLGATVFAVQNARNTGSDPASVAQPAEQAAPAPAPAAEPAKAESLSAEQALASILEPGTPVDSARFSIGFDTEEVRGGREHDTVRITGAFDDADKGPGVSNFDVRYRSRDEISGHRARGGHRRADPRRRRQGLHRPGRRDVRGARALDEQHRHAPDRDVRGRHRQVPRVPAHPLGHRPEGRAAWRRWTGSTRPTSAPTSPPAAWPATSSGS